MKRATLALYTGLLVLGTLAAGLQASSPILGVLALAVFLTVPGRLFLETIGVRGRGIMERFLYSVGASVGIVTFTGLALVGISRLGLLSHPIAAIPVIAGLATVSGALAIIIWSRRPFAPVAERRVRLDGRNRIYAIVPVILFVFACFGALLLNEDYSNFLSMLVLLGIAIHTVAIIADRRRINPNVFAWSILFIAMAILAMGWLRSPHISGVDVNVENWIAQHTIDSGTWSYASFNNPYGACLSITIFPAVLNLISGLSIATLFKTVFPVLFALSALAVFALLRKYAVAPIAYLAALFYVSQPAFVTWMQIPIRQQIALLAFAILLLALFDETIDGWRRTTMVTLLMLLVIVSHYSTAYIAAFLLAAIYLLSLLFKAGAQWRRLDGLYVRMRLRPRAQHRPRVTATIVILAFSLTAFWYSVVTDAGEHLVSVFANVADTGREFFSAELRPQETSVFAQFNIFFHPNNQPVFSNYTRQIAQQYSFIPVDKRFDTTTSDYVPQVVKDPLLAPKLSPVLAKGANIGFELIKKAFKLCIVLGILYYLLRIGWDANIDFEYGLLCIIGLGVLIAMMILPFLTIEYDILRLYQQVVIFLALPAIMGVLLLCYRMPGRMVLVATLVAAYFLITTGFWIQLVGGGPAAMQLNNEGPEYLQNYVTAQDIAAATWLYEVDDNATPIYAGLRARSKLYLAPNSDPSIHTRTDVLPATLEKGTYLYESGTNVKFGVDYVYARGEIIGYNYPLAFIDSNLDRLYDNGGAAVFR